MKIAVATEQGQVAGHFGHCEGFTLFETEGTQIKNQVYVANPGHQPGFLPVFLKEQGAEAIIGGGMGERAQTLFAEQGIEVIVGAEGDCQQAVENYLGGTLKSTKSVCHEHEHAHECGGH
jgi:predicted Fe-Mo cluster-binding NifX family protein